MSGMDLTPYLEFARLKLGFEFKNIDLLVTALTHRSYVNEHKKSAKEHNERLEYLGDAVLELVVTEYLYSRFSEPEGILTSWRAALVRTESIGDAGEKLGFGQLLRVSRGEKNSTGRARLQMMANSFEAVVGAIYLDQGYEMARQFIHDNIIVKLDDILREESWRDPKSHLQELSQRYDGLTPAYKVLTEEGPDHDKLFTLGVYVGDKLMGRGVGSSKQIAQQEAAKQAIEKYHTRSD